MVFVCFARQEAPQPAISGALVFVSLFSFAFLEKSDIALNNADFYSLVNLGLT